MDPWFMPEPAWRLIKPNYLSAFHFNFNFIVILYLTMIVILGEILKDLPTPAFIRN